MEKVIIGYRYVCYPSKKRVGEMTEGYQVYTISKMGDNNGFPAGGFRWYHQKDVETKPMWLSCNQFENLIKKCNGDCLYRAVKFYFNEFGGLADIQVVEK